MKTIFFTVFHLFRKQNVHNTKRQKDAQIYLAAVLNPCKQEIEYVN